MLNDKISSLRGVGAVREKALASIGIETIGDLLHYYPRAYEDRTKFYTISQACDLGNVCIRAVVGTNVKTATIRKGLTISKCRIFDSSGVAEAIFFNRKYLENQLKIGEEYIFFGKITQFNGKLQLENPQFEEVGKDKITGKILPVYPLTEGVTRNFLIGIIFQGLKSTPIIKEYMPQEILDRYGLIGLDEAVRNIHFPSSEELRIKSANRLGFNELVVYSSALSQVKSKTKFQNAPKISPVSLTPFLSKLSFSLTSAQNRVVNEILKDMSSGYSMNRLVQGDVGSGKTIVAACAIYCTALNLFQSAIVAPTEILALQHFNSIMPILSQFNIKGELLLGSTSKKEKERIKKALAEGQIDLIIGTHAILEDNVEFKSPGLFVVDEQHRFGVAQRSKLSSKGLGTHTLVMSATPIPRTLTLIIYGELDVSVIDEMPPNRHKVETFHVRSSYDKRLYGFIDKHILNGSQIYIVCPLALESEESDLASAEEYADFLKKKIFQKYNIAMLHGKLKPKEKSEIMSAFKENKIQILVSTTVIEVGVDVPNATLMIIRNAERFGLSQLHQLRGRVGRGNALSYCILVSDSHNKDTLERLKIMEKTTNGFEIANEDLRLRGPGDFFGMAQHGLPKYDAIVNSADMATVEKAKEFSEKLISLDPNLTNPENSWLSKKVNALRAKIGQIGLN